MNKIFFSIVMGLWASTIFLGCQNKPRGFRKDIDGWLYLTTYKTFPLKSIILDKNFSKIDSGSNCVLSVEITKRVIFKDGIKGSTDFVSYNGLLIELSPEDSIVKPNHLGKSKILRRVFEFPAEFHAYVLKSDEEIEIMRKGINRWSVNSNLEDFQFEGEFSFADSSTITTIHKQMLNNE